MGLQLILSVLVTAVKSKEIKFRPLLLQFRSKITLIVCSLNLEKFTWAKNYSAARSSWAAEEAAIWGAWKSRTPNLQKPSEWVSKRACHSPHRTTLQQIKEGKHHRLKVKASKDSRLRKNWSSWPLGWVYRRHRTSKDRRNKRVETRRTKRKTKKNNPRKNNDKNTKISP